MGNPGSENGLKELLDLRVKCLNNLVLTYQKLGQEDKALEHCDQVLALDQKNIKALFKKGKILLQKNEFDAAIETLSAAATVEPGNALFKEELRKAKQSKATFSKKERSVYSNMLKAMRDDDHASANVSPAQQTSPEVVEEDSIVDQSLDDSRAEIDVVGVSPVKQPPATQKEQDSAPAHLQQQQQETSNPLFKEDTEKPKNQEPREPPAAAAAAEQQQPDKKKSVVPPPKPKGVKPQSKVWYGSLSRIAIISVVVAIIAFLGSRSFL